MLGVPVGNTSILVVDDESAVLRTTELILQSAGYTVSTATSAGDAIQLLQSRHFDFLLLDCIPSRDWVVLEAKRLNPGLRAAVCTGDSETTELPLVDIVLHKPLPPLVLLKEIGALLCLSKAA